MIVTLNLLEIWIHLFKKGDFILKKQNNKDLELGTGFRVKTNKMKDKRCIVSHHDLVQRQWCEEESINGNRWIALMTRQAPRK